MAERGASLAEGVELASLPPAAVLAYSPSLSSSTDAMSRKPASLASISQAPLLTALPALENVAHMEDLPSRLRRLSMDEPEAGAAQELPPVDRGRGAWTFVAAAFILDWGFSYSFASILVYLEKTEPWSNTSLASLSAIGTTQLAVQFVLPIVVINIFRRYPDKVKPMLWISLAVNCLSMLIAGWAKQVIMYLSQLLSHFPLLTALYMVQVWQLILLQGVLGGMSGAVLYAPVLLWMQGWFLERRGLASGIIFSGTGIGGFAFPFLIGKLLDSYGFSWMCRIWAMITAVCYSASVYFIRPRTPPVKPMGPRGKWLAVDFRSLNHPIVWVMTATTFASSLAYFPVSLYLPTYTVSLLHTTSLLRPNLVVGLFNAAASLGSTAIGYLSDRSYPATVVLIGLSGTVVALGAWGTADTLSRVFGFAILFGFSSQICSAAARDVAGLSLFSSTRPHFLPPSFARGTSPLRANPHASTMIFCTFGIVRGIASIVGPMISTSLYKPDETDSARQAWGRFGFRDVIVFGSSFGHAPASSRPRFGR
ncbi:SPOSA6832_02419, partial [Sporobolomyces salmonicolor]